MRSLRLHHFRSFVDTRTYNLKPITLLVGANSSGKSSYLRFFPLLRQTAETPTRSPLLWYGNYVDFGDFSQVAFRDASPKTISFEIQIDVPSGRQPRRGAQSEMIPLQISVTIAPSALLGASHTYVSRVELRAWDDVCLVEFSEEDVATKFIVNDINILPYFTKPLQAIRSGFFPNLSYHVDDSPSADFRVTPLHSALVSRLIPLAHNRTSATRLVAYSRRLAFTNIPSMLKTIRDFGLRYYSSPDIGDSVFNSIRALTFAKDLPILLYRAQAKLAAFSRGINYLGPFRKNPERFYRQQEISIGQIEPHGENLAMFLRTLSRAQMQELSDFIEATLDVRVSAEDDGKHVSVYVEEGEARRYNLIDMGYGLSQVLPVLALCWTTAYNIKLVAREQTVSVLAIEQPELHLHPRHQARLADMFATVIDQARKHKGVSAKQEELWPNEDSFNFPLSLLIETHSEALVNRLGELVEAGTLSADDVTVLLFEKDPVKGSTIINESNFDKHGVLHNWPLGFFAP